MLLGGARVEGGREKWVHGLMWCQRELSLAKAVSCSNWGRARQIVMRYDHMTTMERCRFSSRQSEIFLLYLRFLAIQVRGGKALLSSLHFITAIGHTRTTHIITMHRRC